MSTLRLQLRFMLPLLAAVGVAAVVSLLLCDRLELTWFSRDLDLRGALVSDALSDSIDRAMQDSPSGVQHLRAVFDRTVRDERLVAIALCAPGGVQLGSSSGFPGQLDCAQALSLAARLQWPLPSGMAHVGWYPIVNPYHVEEGADALHRALTMPVAEQRERMGSLRAVVREHNVYRWTARMLGDAGRWRLRERIEARVERHSAEVA